MSLERVKTKLELKASKSESQPSPNDFEKGFLEGIYYAIGVISEALAKEQDKPKQDFKVIRSPYSNTVVNELNDLSNKNYKVISLVWDGVNYVTILGKEDIVHKETIAEKDA